MSQAPQTPQNDEILELEHKLLRTEQQCFEQLDQQAKSLEAMIAEKQQLNDQLVASRADVQRLQEQLQAQTQQITHLNQVIADQRASLDRQEQALNLVQLQLDQAQEELSTTLILQQSYEQWQAYIKCSISAQAKLLCRSLILRGIDRLRWLLPTAPLRRHKARLYQLLGRTI